MITVRMKLLSIAAIAAMSFANLTAAPSKGVPLDVKLEKTNGGETTLQEIADNKKAILIDFWATYCGPCKKSLPSLKEKAAKLAPHGVEVVAINLDDKKKAESFRQDLDIDFPWLAENYKPFYSKELKVKSVPRMVLLSASGEVLFSGHPSDQKGLNQGLAKVGVKL